MDALEREVLAQKVWLGRCEDTAALLDRMAEYREDIRLAARAGNTLLQLRASDLLELAEERVVELKAARIAVARAQDEVRRREAEARVRREAEEQRARAAAEAEARRPVEASAAAERLARTHRLAEAEAGRQAEERARSEAEAQRARAAANAEQHAAARLANARAAEVEARVALLRAEAKQIVGQPEPVAAGQVAEVRSPIVQVAAPQAAPSAVAPARMGLRAVASPIELAGTPPPAVARARTERVVTPQSAPAVVAPVRTVAQPARSPLGQTVMASTPPSPHPAARSSPPAPATPRPAPVAAASARMVVHSKRSTPERAAAAPTSPSRPLATPSSQPAPSTPQPASVAAAPTRMVVYSKRPTHGRAAKAPIPPSPPAPVRTEARPARSTPESEAAPTEDPMDAADREALMRVGRWPLPPPQPESMFWRPDDHWPRDWTLTGYDLAIFRGSLSVSQRVLAGQLGVPTVEVGRAEARTREKLRPALQVAVKEEMERAQVARLARRQAVAAPTQEKGAEPVVLAESVAVAPAAAASPEVASAPVSPGASPTPEALIGADLARWRAEAGLSQRQAAARLGVAHGTVAKAELADEKALGEQLHRALREAISA